MTADLYMSLRVTVAAYEGSAVGLETSELSHELTALAEWQNSFVEFGLVWKLAGKCYGFLNCK